MADVVIPIVFPNYLITVETPATRIEIPDIIPYVDILPNEIRVPHTKNKLSDLGHAGVLFINGKSGKRGRISGAYIEVENKYNAMLAYAQNRMRMNFDKNRDRYDIVSYSCLHFMKGVMEAAELDTPWLIDPRPVSYIREIQHNYPNLEYIPSQHKLIIEESEPVSGFNL